MDSWGRWISQCALILKVVVFYISVCGVIQQVLRMCYRGPRKMGHSLSLPFTLGYVREIDFHSYFKLWLSCFVGNSFKNRLQVYVSGDSSWLWVCSALYSNCVMEIVYLCQRNRSQDVLNNPWPLPTKYSWWRWLNWHFEESYRYSRLFGRLKLGT